MLLYLLPVAAAQIIIEAASAPQNLGERLRNQSPFYREYYRQNPIHPIDADNALERYRRAKRASKQESWQELVDIFWEKDWPKSFTPIFARAYFELIQMSSSLENRKKLVRALTERSPQFKEAAPFKKILSFSEWAQVIRPPKATWNTKPWRKEYDIYVDGIRQENAEISLTLGVHRISLISDRYNKETHIVTVRENFELTPSKEPLASGNCWNPSFSPALNQLGQKVQVYYSENCGLERRWGRWHFVTTGLPLQTPPSPSVPEQKTKSDSEIWWMVGALLTAIALQ